jgi:murein DD-endopeptidase MepM/ murein hydrolase activator NlpD
VYSHLQEYSVSAGQKIKKGAVIGKVGKSGNAKSPQLHLQIFDVNRKDKTRTPVDPEKILP